MPWTCSRTWSRKQRNDKEPAVQLTVREASLFLNVSEGTVTRWIKQRGLPAQYVAGRYRFHRTELLEWATAQKIKVSLELFNQLDEDDDVVPTLCEALA